MPHDAKRGRHTFKIFYFGSSSTCYCNFANIYNFDILKIQDIMELFNKEEVLISEIQPTINIILENYFYYDLIYIDEKTDYIWIETKNEVLDVVVWNDELNYKVLSIKEYVSSI